MKPMAEKYKEDMMNERYKEIAQQRSEDLHYKTDAQMQLKKQVNEIKMGQIQDKNAIALKDKLMSLRGMPQIGQAEKDLYNIDKINSLVSLYGDPNKLNPQQIQLLTTEAAKVASGGVPSIHEMRGLNPDTLPKWVADKAQFFKNTPTAANAGAFAKALQDYATAIGKDAKKIITESYGRQINSVARQLKPEDLQTIKDNFSYRFDTPGVDSKEEPAKELAKARTIPPAGDSTTPTIPGGTKAVATKPNPTGRQYSAKSNQTKFLYADGTSEIVPGR
jgi:hypothetical protein